jgi:hypothetical protein
MRGGGAKVGEQRDEVEEATQQSGASGDPGYGLDALWMESKGQGG